MCIVARKLSDNEPDLLIGHEHEDLIITDLDKVTLKVIRPPTNGWTHDILESINYYSINDAWDAYLGKQWIGCSEV